MKKIIFSFCIAIVASLGANYVSAGKPPLHFFYGRTINETYTKIYGIYNGTNCADFTGHEDTCGYILMPAGQGIVPNTFDAWQADYFQYKQYLVAIPGGEGIYLTN